MALLPLLGRLGGGGVVLFLLILLLTSGRTCGTAEHAGVPGGGQAGAPAAEDELVQFVSFVFDDAQAAWADRFRAAGQAYAPARLVLFDRRVSSACGAASSAVGPFYCPADQRVYIDLSFYRELRRRFGAPGDFAQAYVIAHEVGHHVQALAGTLKGGRGDARESVARELQADCYAGLWAHSTRERDLLERGDVEEALGAAAAIGDDRLQREATGQVTPETWTHGSSTQRVAAFRRGLETGDPAACALGRAGPE